MTFHKNTVICRTDYLMEAELNLEPEDNDEELGDFIELDPVEEHIQMDDQYSEHRSKISRADQEPK